MIGIVDYNAGNITSVEHALKSIGAEYVLSKNPEDLKNADKIIFPGVGDAAYAMEQLKQTGFDVFLKLSTFKTFPSLTIPSLSILSSKQFITLSTNTKHVSMFLI